MSMCQKILCYGDSNTYKSLRPDIVTTMLGSMIYDRIPAYPLKAVL